MNSLKYSALTLGLLWTTLGQATTHEITQMNEILSSITPGTLVVFDIDNTILRPVQSLGSDQWGGTRQALYKQTMPERAAIEKGVGEFAEVQRHTRVMPVEAATPALIHALQAHGNLVMALTARPLDLMDRSLESLKSIDVDLAPSAPAVDASALHPAEPVLYRGGVLAVGPFNNKGLVLAQFLKLLSAQPAKIVFTDDKRHHVDDVEAALAPTGIPYDGFRYGAADAIVKALDLRVTDLEYKLFNDTSFDLNPSSTILSDERATELLKNPATAVKALFQNSLNFLTEPAGDEPTFAGCDVGTTPVNGNFHAACQGRIYEWDGDTGRFEAVKLFGSYLIVPGSDGIASVTEESIDWGAPSEQE